MLNRYHLMIALGLAVGCSDATTSDDAPAPVVDSTGTDIAGTALGAAGKADGTDVRVQGNRVFIYGDAATELADFSENYFDSQVSQENGATYVRGPLGLCAYNDTQAACVTELDQRFQQDGYALTFGGRLRNAGTAATKAYYLTQAIRLANGESTRINNGDNFASSGAFDCVINRSSNSYALCGIKIDVDVPQEGPKTVVEFNAENLESLGDDYVYEGWLIVDGQPIAAGRFDGTGNTQNTFEIDGDLTDASFYVLTIEPKVGDDPAPSDVHIVGGDFRNGVAPLDVEHRAALGDSFANSFGQFILETPSSSDTSDYDQGIWFVNPTNGSASLDLPTLPAGWAYEGWVVGENGPVSTGTFTNPAAADSDGAGPAAGPNGTPPFPGQDFINPAMSLIGHTVVISIEPSPDNSPAPFQLKPLVGQARDAGAGGLQGLDTDVSAFPVGAVSISLR